MERDVEHLAQVGERAGVLGLDRPGAAAEDPRGLGDVEVEPVAQHDDGALARRQAGERVGDDGPGLVVRTGWRGRPGVAGSCADSSRRRCARRVSSMKACVSAVRA